jgi:hypothetical protein
MCDVLGVGGVEVALRVTEVMDGIEHVCFAAAVVPDDAIHPRTPCDFCVRVVAKCEELHPGQLHVANFPNFAVALTEPFEGSMR